MHLSLTNALLTVIASLHGTHLWVSARKPTCSGHPVAAEAPAVQAEPTPGISAELPVGLQMSNVVLGVDSPAEVPVKPVGFAAQHRIPWRKRRAVLEAQHRTKRAHIQELESE